MNYLTTVEMSKIWGISSRRISLMCSQNRIEGAVKKGKTWLIPIEAKKPIDPRREKKMENRRKGARVRKEKKGQKGLTK